MGQSGQDIQHPHWRCFWAALLDAQSDRRLAALVEDLRGAAPDGLRWTPRANWHLTLHFLGPIGTAQTVALGRALRERPLPAPLTLVLREIGPFPRFRPRTLAARLDTSEALAGWVRYVRQCATDVGLAADDRAFRAHLTVARPGRGRGDTFPELLTTGELCFDRIALMRSDLGAGGAVYRPLAVQTAG